MEVDILDTSTGTVQPSGDTCALLDPSEEYIELPVVASPTSQYDRPRRKRIAIDMSETASPAADSPLPFAETFETEISATQSHSTPIKSASNWPTLESVHTVASTAAEAIRRLSKSVDTIRDVKMHRLIPKLRDFSRLYPNKSMTVDVVGPPNAMKSSLINCLCNANILPQSPSTMPRSITTHGVYDQSHFTVEVVFFAVHDIDDIFAYWNPLFHGDMEVTYTQKELEVHKKHFLEMFGNRDYSQWKCVEHNPLRYGRGKEPRMAVSFTKTFGHVHHVKQYLEEIESPNKTVDSVGIPMRSVVKEVVIKTPYRSLTIPRGMILREIPEFQLEYNGRCGDLELNCDVVVPTRLPRCPLNIPVFVLTYNHRDFDGVKKFYEKNGIIGVHLWKHMHSVVNGPCPSDKTGVNTLDCLLHTYYMDVTNRLQTRRKELRAIQSDLVDMQQSNTVGNYARILLDTFPVVEEACSPLLRPYTFPVVEEACSPLLRPDKANSEVFPITSSLDEVLQNSPDISEHDVDY